MKKYYLIVGLLVVAIALSGCTQQEDGAGDDIPSILKTNPLNEAKQLITDVGDAPGTLKTSEAIGFTSGYVLSGSEVSQRVAIKQEQICFSLGDFVGSADFELVKEGDVQKIVYTGSGMNAKLKVVCHVRASYLLEDITKNGLEAGNSKVNCQSIEGKACLIYLEKA